MKIYTKKGDQGETDLYDGNRTLKSDLIFQVIGEFDELSVSVGACAMIRDEYEIFFRKIQSIIQMINSILATVEKTKKLYNNMKEEYITELETEIDKMTEELPTLTKFILPCQTLGDYYAHVCRVKARKAERMLIQLVSGNKPHEIYSHNRKRYICVTNDENMTLVLKYVNRLSDFFFTYARWVCMKQDATDVFMIDL